MSSSEQIRESGRPSIGQTNTSASHITKQAGLSRLPAEMILAIGKRVEKIRDLTAFAVSNRLMYRTLGCSVIQRNPAKALMHCAARNDVEGIQIALHAKAGINTLYAPTYNERKALLGKRKTSKITTCTSLHVAAINGSIGAAKYLLEHGASVDAETDDKITPLWVAAHCGCVEMVRLLNEKGGDIERVDSRGLTPLHYFTQKKGNEPMVRCLLKLGANIHAQDALDGNTPLGLAARAGAVFVCRLLLEKRGDINYINYRNRSGGTALHMAAQGGHVALTKYLLRKGASMSATDNYGKTALLSAASFDRTDICRLLLKKGSGDINQADSNGDTLLHIATDCDNVKLIRYLLKKGADVHKRNWSGDIALGLAAQGAARLPDQPLSRSEISGREIQDIHERAALAKEIFQLLRQNGSDINHKNNDGYTPVQLGERAHREFNINLDHRRTVFGINKSLHNL